MPTLPLGLACVAEATRDAGHEVALIDLMDETDTQGTIRRFADDFHPDIIGISVRNVDDQNMEEPRFLLHQAREVVSCCKRFTDAPLVLGGAGYSIFPQEALEYLGANMGIKGEGEACFPELLDRIQNHRDLSGLPGLYVGGRGFKGERRFLKDLDSFPLPDLDLFSTSSYKKEDVWMPVQTRRGCPMRCSYCSTPSIEGRLIRKRSRGDIIRWLSRLVEAGFCRFHFVDNTFNLPPSYARSFCSLMAEAGLNIEWRCILYPGNVDEPLVKEMARAGCKEVSLGFESGSNGILRTMNKKFDTEQIRRASWLLGDYGIQRMGFLLLGGPGETRGSVEESLRFVDSLDLEANKVTKGIRIYSHTKLVKVAYEEGVLSRDDNLLFPKFYMERGLRGWLRRTVDEWAKGRPNWFVSG